MYVCLQPTWHRQFPSQFIFSQFWFSQKQVSPWKSQKSVPIKISCYTVCRVIDVVISHPLPCPTITLVEVGHNTNISVTSPNKAHQHQAITILNYVPGTCTYSSNLLRIWPVHGWGKLSECNLRNFFSWKSVFKQFVKVFPMEDSRYTGSKHSTSPVTLQIVRCCGPRRGIRSCWQRRWQL